MNKSFDYPYNYFKTNKNISTSQVKTNNDIFSNISSKKTILQKHNNRKNKNIKYSIILDELNNIYIHKLCNERNVRFFFESVYRMKIILEDCINSIKEFETIDFTTDKSIKNPFNNNSFQYFFDKEYFTNQSPNVIIYTNILLYGDVLHFSLPSIGIIYHKKLKSYSRLIEKIINTNDILLLTSDLPLLDIQIVYTIKKHFTYKKMNLFTNNLLTTIDERISNIKITVMSQKMKNYIVPFKINDKIKPIKIETMKTNYLYLSKNINSIIESNNKIVIFALENIDDNKEIIIQILASYLFSIIQLVTDIMINYANAIDKEIDFFANIYSKRGILFDLKEIYQYTNLLKTSILKFKLILLNNFYYLFLPLTDTHKQYGMKLDNYYVCESSFLAKVEDVILKYPFRLDGNSLVINEENMKLFLTKIVTEKDIYEDIRLEFGASIYDSYLFLETKKIFTEYYSILLKNNQFTLSIVNNIIKYFKRNIPLELIQYVRNIVNREINDQEIDKYYEIFSNKFTLDIIEMKKIGEHIENIKKIKNINKEMTTSKEIAISSLLVYQTIISINKEIIQKCVKNMKLRQKLLLFINNSIKYLFV